MQWELCIHTRPRMPAVATFCLCKGMSVVSDAVATQLVAVCNQRSREEAGGREEGKSLGPGEMKPVGREASDAMAVLGQDIIPHSGVYPGPLTCAHTSRLLYALWQGMAAIARLQRWEPLYPATCIAVVRDQRPLRKR